MLKVEFKKPTREDAVFISRNLREDNKAEIYAVIGDNAESDILRSLNFSRESGCCYFNDKPAAIYGIIPDSVMSSSGLLWLLMTSETLEHRVIVGRNTKNAIEGLLRGYTRLYNYVNADNENIIRWLKWLGAKFYGPFPHGIYGRLHYYFEFTRKESD